MACVHGFEPGECLICRVLDDGTPKVATATGPGRRRAGDGLQGGPVDVVPGRRPGRPRRRPGRRSPAVTDARRVGTAAHLVGGLLLAVGVLIALFFVAGVVFAVLRLIEILAVAAVVGLVAYRVGRLRGRRGR